MAENHSMFERFQMMLNADREAVISQIGRPGVSFPSFSIYHRNGLWMVLYFQDAQVEDTLRSLLKGITFFDESLKLLWTSGIPLVTASARKAIGDWSTMGEAIALFGPPHATFGAGVAALQYLSEEGALVFVRSSGENAVEITSVPLPELTEIC